MSIYIKGMEMPEHCGYCRFRYDGICHALQKTQYNKADCPLVPVPPHGRLIDADALEDMDSETCDTDDGVQIKERVAGRNSIRKIIHNAATVIEAEEGK